MYVPVHPYIREYFKFRRMQEKGATTVCECWSEDDPWTIPLPGSQYSHIAITGLYSVHFHSIIFSTKRAQEFSIPNRQRFVESHYWQDNCPKGVTGWAGTMADDYVRCWPSANNKFIQSNQLSSNLGCFHVWSNRNFRVTHWNDWVQYSGKRIQSIGRSI